MPKPRAPRKRVLKAAHIVFGGAAIDCVVRNLSSTGAALDVESPLGIPPTFTLVVKQDGFAKQCRVAWRKEKRIGISFDGSDET